MAFLGSHLLTVGQDGNILVYSINPAAPAAAAAPWGAALLPGPRSSLRASGSLAALPADQRHMLVEQQQQQQHPDSNVIMRSWLEPASGRRARETEMPAAVSAAASAATAAAASYAANSNEGQLLPVPEEQLITADEGKEVAC